MPEIKGGCLCGAVRYTASAELALVGVCHCRDCQKFTGSAFGFFIGVPRSAFEIKGVLKTFSKLGDSGNPIVRRFCPECGSSIVEEPPGQRDLAIINAGTLDDPSAVTPTMEIYCDRELPWVRLDGMQRYPRMPV
jgi:hypothetical protein